MNNLLILPYVDSESWRIARLQGIGSSECATMLGKSPWATRDELYTLKTLGHNKEFDSKTLARFQAGHDLEPAIAVKAYRELNHLFTGRALYDPQSAIVARQFDDNEGGEPFWLTATVDRLLVPELHGLFNPHLVPAAYPTFHIMECKSGSSVKDEEISEQYLYQVQHQLLVTGCPRAYLVHLALAGTSRWDKLSRSQMLCSFAEATLRHWVVEPDESIHQEILREAARLCREVNSYRAMQGLPSLSVERWSAGNV